MKKLLLITLLSPMLCMGQLESSCADRFFITPSLGAFITHDLKPGINAELGVVKWKSNWYATVSFNMVNQPDSVNYEVGMKFYKKLVDPSIWASGEEPKNHFTLFFSNRYTTKNVMDKQGLQMPKWIYGGGIEYDIRLNPSDPYHVEFLAIYIEYTHQMDMGGFRLGINLGGIF